MSTDAVENLSAGDILSGVDDTPLTPGEYDQMGGYTPLDTGVERLIINKMVQKGKTARRGYTALNLRMELKVAPDAITNNPGRVCSVFFDFPSTEAQAGDDGLKQNYQINLSDFKEFIAAALGATDAENPGDYPVVDDGSGGDAMVNPIAFITNPDYQSLLEGRTFKADLGLESPTWTDKNEVVHQRKRINNTVTNPRVDA